MTPPNDKLPPSSAERAKYEFVREVLDVAEAKCAKENYTLEAGVAAAFFEVSGPIVDAVLPQQARAVGGVE